jgi:hypothetical protein
MNTHLDKLQQAWQSQRCAAPPMNPDKLLRGVRLWRRAGLWTDILVIVGLLYCGSSVLGSAVRDIHKGWPFLFYGAGIAWVVGYILFNRWRRRREPAHTDEPLLVHVEYLIKDIEHRIWLDRNSFWWYILPIALGCMIPPILLFAMDYRRHHGWVDIFALFSMLGFFAIVFIVVHLIMKYGRHISEKERLKELQALRLLRETLLNTEEPPI